MKNFIVALFIIFSVSAFAQKRQYLDEYKRKVLDPTMATFYRVIEPDGKLYLVGIFYVSNDQPEMAATASQISPEIIYDGKCRFFHENGKVKSEGEYKNDKRVGVWKSYHDNGQLAEETFEDDEKTTYKQCWDESGTPLLTNGSGSFKRKSLWKDEQYEYFEILNSEFIASYHIEASGDSIYTVVQETATYKDGMEGLYRMIGKTVRYPADARRFGIQGKVFIQFTIDKNGMVRDVSCLKGIGGGCDEEGVRVLSLMNKWTPGKVKGKVVRQRMVLPVAFRLG